MKKFFIFFIIVIITITFACCGNSKDSTEGDIKDVPSETREVLKEECYSLLSENNIHVEDQKVRVSYMKGECFLYFNEYRIQGENINFIAHALANPESAYAPQWQAVEFLKKSEFRLEENTIIIDYTSVLKEEFEELKKEVTVVQSQLREDLKQDLLKFLEDEGVKVDPANAFIKVLQDGDLYRIYLIAIVEKNLPTLMQYPIYFVANASQGEEIAEAIFNGDSMKLPSFSYRFYNNYYIEAFVE